MKGKQIFHKMTNILDMNEESISGKTLVEILDNRSVLIEHHCGVLSYSSECISIKTKYGAITVVGCSLYIHRISKEQLRIVGNVKKVELNGRYRKCE